MVHARARLKAASEDGFGLIEVLVSSMVLVLVVLGILAAMDSITGTAGANKARTIAAALAERDQERLRGMRTLDIDEMNLEPYTVNVAGVDYQVTSAANWVYDASGDEVSCGAVGANQASYMRITSTVTSPITGDAVKPVVLSSLVAPQVGNSKGTLTVIVNNAHGQPVQSLPVTANPTGRQEPTNAEGCAVFGQLDAGAYTVSLNTAGWVDKDGNPTPSQAVNVVAGSLASVEFAYDKAASIDVVVKTKPVASGGVDDPAKSVIAVNGGMTAGLRAFDPENPGPNNPQGSTVAKFPTGTGTVFELRNLFPFVDGYTIYSGSCLANDPSQPHLVPNYFETYEGSVTLGPWQHGGTLTTYEPKTNFVFRRQVSGSPLVSGVTVYAYPKECGGGRIELGTTNSSGVIPNYQGLPYGLFDICAYQSTGGSNRYKAVDEFLNNKPEGQTTQTTVTLDRSSSNTPCGAATP